MNFIEDHSLITSFKKSCTINNNEETEICGICGDEIEEIKDKDELKCGHIYCHECIYLWFESIFLFKLS